MSFKKSFQDILYKIECRKDLRIKKKILARKRKEILEFYSKKTTDDVEINDAVSYLKTNSLQTFNSAFTKTYKWKNVQVYKDDSKDLPYVIHEGKRLYFTRSYRKRTIQYSYCGLLTEQDFGSPHCYLGEGFNIQENDVLLDVGSAEGILSLQFIEKVKYVVLFERDPQWVEALEATFEPWKEKVTIVRKFVSNLNDDENITLDSYLADKDHVPSVIKIDVEGAEKKVLEGMTETMNIPGLKIAICTYHHEQDYSTLSGLLVQSGFSCQPSKGMMLFLNDMESMRPPYFRKGLIRAKKQNA